MYVHIPQGKKNDKIKKTKIEEQETSSFILRIYYMWQNRNLILSLPVTNPGRKYMIHSSWRIKTNELLKE